MEWPDERRSAASPPCADDLFEIDGGLVGAL
jgi:hypothetical protein